MNVMSSAEPHYSAVVVGGGQAGLSASYWLSQAGLDHVVFEKKTAMHKWREERWDAFCLVTPNWQCQLPGHPYAGPDPHGFMVKHEILDYLDAFQRKVDAPLRENVEVRSVERVGDRFRITSAEGVCTADAVFLATSLYGKPSVPRFAERIPDSIVQIHTVDYRNAAALPEGAVVVVGSGQSGAQIAEDLHLNGRKVHMVTGNAPRCARFYRGRDVVDWLWDVGQYAITVADDGMGHKRHDTNHYLTGRDGGRDIDLRVFAKDGMSLYGRLRTVEQGRMLFEPNLRANLDEADRVYNGINALIDRHIAANGDLGAGGRGLRSRLGACRRAGRARPFGGRRRRRRLGDRVHPGLVLRAPADLRWDRLSDQSARRDRRSRRLCPRPALALDLGLRALPQRRARRGTRREGRGLPQRSAAGRAMRRGRKPVQAAGALALRRANPIFT